MWLAIEPANPRVEFGDILMPGLMLAGAILLAAVVLMLLKRWRSTAESFESPHEQLAQYRAMFERGDLTKEEFDRIHGLLTSRIRKEMGEAVGPSADLGSAKPSSVPSGEKPATPSPDGLLAPPSEPPREGT